jgi:hypothetical protein
MKQFLYILLPVLFLSQCRPKEENILPQFPGKPEVPSSLKQVHESLLGKIHEVTLFQDSAGRAAVKLEELMRYHFKEEEEYVLPPLGLLPLLASGQLPEQSSHVILLTEKFRSQSAKIYAEHQMIKALMDEMMQADGNKSHPEIMEFENELLKHATAEEEVFFPASLLVGDYLKLKSRVNP